MAATVRVAVLGVGSLGRQHARVYGEMHRHGTVELVGVYDSDPAQARSIAEKYSTVALGSVEAAAAAADALSIVTPTITHPTLAKPLLARCKLLLVEKPLPVTVRAALSSRGRTNSSKTPLHRLAVIRVVM